MDENTESRRLKMVKETETEEVERFQTGRKEEAVYGMKSPEMEAFSGMPIRVSFRGRGQRAFGYSGTNWSF